jgi:hypothetical protein
VVSVDGIYFFTTDLSNENWRPCINSSKMPIFFQRSTILLLYLVKLFLVKGKISGGTDDQSLP